VSNSFLSSRSLVFLTVAGQVTPDTLNLHGVMTPIALFDLPPLQPRRV
jgi:hypothetical protein